MKSRRRREWFRRSSAMFMALALIISGLSLPEGLFSITASKSGKLVNSNNDELLINANSGKMANRSLKAGSTNKDFQVNAGTVMTFPVINNAKSCTVTLQASSGITVDDIECTGMNDVKVTSGGSKSYVITGMVDKCNNSIC